MAAAGGSSAPSPDYSWSQTWLALCQSGRSACEIQSQVTWNPFTIQNTSSNNTTLPQELTRNPLQTLIRLFWLRLWPFLAKSSSAICTRLHWSMWRADRAGKEEICSSRRQSAHGAARRGVGNWSFSRHSQSLHWGVYVFVCISYGYSYILTWTASYIIIARVPGPSWPPVLITTRLSDVYPQVSKLYTRRLFVKIRAQGLTVAKVCLGLRIRMLFFMY